MSSSAESISSSLELSPTASFSGSMVSMKTEDNNELYDHRTHKDSLPIRNYMATTSDQKLRNKDLQGNAEGLPQFTLSEDTSAQRPYRQDKVPPVTERMMSFDDDSDNDVGMPCDHMMSTIQTSNARPSRLAHSIPHQQQLFIDNSIGEQLSPKQSRISRAQSMTNEGTGPTPKNRANSSSTTYSNAVNLLSKTLTQQSGDDVQGQQAQPLRNKATRASFDSENSQATRDSQETEEDVCFPMFPKFHTRINGIDFDELEEYTVQINDQKQEYMRNIYHNQVNQQSIFKDTAVTSSTSTSSSSAALKYTPKYEQITTIISPINSNSTPQGISFGHNKVESDGFPPLDDSPLKINVKSTCLPDHEEETGPNCAFECPNRYSFFCSESDETVHAPDIASLVKPNQSFFDLFRGGEPTWWLDCSCPTDDEMRCIAKAFGIHPLTAEDIRMQETREKVEMFKSYYFVCFHTFENDKESEDYLEPINVYIVVLRTGILTFHFGPISHCANVRRRVRQLRDYVNVNSDWLCYALIDDITDSFAPVIHSIEYEADTIEDSVFMAGDMDFSRMLQRIGESRRKTMTLMRLLSGKADVIKMFAKRCQDEVSGIGPALTSQVNIANLQAESINMGNRAVTEQVSQPRADIALYLGDIQDHLLTMFQNLLAYEKIFSRSHSNYLAQLQVESFNSNNRATNMLGKVTMIGTMLIPHNVITGLFGMNVTVPGEQGSPIWWYGILAVLIALAIISWFLASYWIGRIDPPKTLNEAAESDARSIITNLFPRGRHNRKYNENTNSRNPNHFSNRSIQSLPSKYSRYN